MKAAYVLVTRFEFRSEVAAVVLVAWSLFDNIVKQNEKNDKSRIRWGELMRLASSNENHGALWRKAMAGIDARQVDLK